MFLTLSLSFRLLAIVESIYIVVFVIPGFEPLWLRDTINTNVFRRMCLCLGRESRYYLPAGTTSGKPSYKKDGSGSGEDEVDPMQFAWRFCNTGC